MHIVIDIRSLQTPSSRHRGIGYSLRGWLCEFLKMPYDHRVTLLMDPRFDPPEIAMPLSGEFWKTVEFESYPEIMSLPDLEMESLARRATEKFLREQQVDLFHVHSPFEVAVTLGYPPRSCRCVATFHDALPVLFPGEYLALPGPQYAMTYYAKLQALKHCSHIVAVSRSAASDLVKFTDVSADRIDVIYNAPSPEMFVQPSLEDVRRSKFLRKIDGPYIFSLLGDNPTKNAERLIEAFCRLPSEIRLNYKLVITYRIPVWHRATVQMWLEKYQAKGRIIFTDWVSREELRVLFANADLYVHPALYEGFGMPIVEAMALGTPVVVSNTGPMPEVVGDAGLTFDPYDVDAIMNTLNHVLRDSDLRLDLGRRATARARDFTWEKAALAVRQVYEKALSEQPAIIAAGDDWQETAEVEILKLADAADVVDGLCVGESNMPVVGKLSTWIRRNATSHVHEAYFDLMLRKQVEFNQKFSHMMRSAWYILMDRERTLDLMTSGEDRQDSKLSRSILEQASQASEKYTALNGYLIAGPLPEYGNCLGREFYGDLYLAGLMSMPDVDAKQQAINLELMVAMHKLAWYVEEYYDMLDIFRRSIAFHTGDLDADVMLRDYVVQSTQPLVGSLIVWVRRNLTSHLREPYIDPVIERQVVFNQLALECLRDIRGINLVTLQNLGSAADIMRSGYTVRSQKFIVGPLIAAVRRDLTSHLRKPYIDPIFERQMAFNFAVVDGLTFINREVARLHIKEHYEALPSKFEINRRLRALKDRVFSHIGTVVERAAGQTGFSMLLTRLIERMETRVEEQV